MMMVQGTTVGGIPVDTQAYLDRVRAMMVAGH
jgi:hypothetical protein